MKGAHSSNIYAFSKNSGACLTNPLTVVILTHYKLGHLVVTETRFLFMICFLIFSMKQCIFSIFIDYRGHHIKGALIYNAT